MYLRCYLKKPGQKPRHIVVKNTLKDIQWLVDGYIETITVPVETSNGKVDVVMILNEEGKNFNLDLNFNVSREWVHGRILNQIVGDVAFLGQDGEDFTDVPLSYEDFKEAFPDLFDRRKAYGRRAIIEI